MALSVKIDSFLANTASGNQSITGVGFQPKAIIFFCNYDFTDDTELADAAACYGFATGASNRASSSIVTRNNWSPTDIACGYSEIHCIYMVNTSALELIAADFVSFDADGFTIDWTNVTGTATRIGYIALGGTDLTDAIVKSYTYSATGDQALTGAGFEPTSAILIGNGYGTTTGNKFGQNGDSGLFLGATDGSGQICLGNAAAEFVNPTQSRSYHSTNNLIALPKHDGTTLAAATLSSLDADGLTLNFSTVASGARFHVLYLRGASFKVGAFQKPTTTGSDSITGVGFTPKGIIALSDNYIGTTADVISTDLNICFGAGDGITQSGMYAFDDQGVSGSATAKRGQDNDKIIWMRDTSTLGLASLTSLDSDGFTLDWLTSDANDRKLMYFAFGDGVVPTEYDESVSSTLVLTQVLAGPIQVSASNSLSLTHQVSLDGIGAKYASAVSSLSSLSQLLSHNFKLLDISDSFSLSADATNNQKPISTSSSVGLTDLAYAARTIEQFLSDLLVTTDDAQNNFRITNASNIVTLSDEVIVQLNNDYILGVLHGLGLTQDAQTAFEFVRQIPLSSSDSDNLLKLDHIVDVHGTKRVSASNILSLSNSANLVGIILNKDVVSSLLIEQQLQRIREFAASSAFTLTDEVIRRFLASSDLGLSQSVVLSKSIFGKSTLALSHVISRIMAYNRAIVSSLSVNQSVGYIKNSTAVAIAGRTRKQTSVEQIYSPFVGTLTSGITPPSTTEPTLGTNTLTLTYPFTSPTTTLILRNPDFGNTQTHNYSRINRESRGGTLMVYSDPNWPKVEKLTFTVNALSEAKKDALLDFLEASLGQEIGLLDHENRQWRGFITTPDADVTHEGRGCTYSVTFSFEGNLA